MKRQAVKITGLLIGLFWILVLSQNFLKTGDAALQNETVSGEEQRTNWQTSQVL